jgi:hypothetical protein
VTRTYNPDAFAAAADLVVTHAEAITLLAALNTQLDTEGTP